MICCEINSDERSQSLIFTPHVISAASPQFRTFSRYSRRGGRPTPATAVVPSHSNWILNRRGTLVNTVSGACFGRPPPVYVCDHDTAPPEDQVVKQDYTNVVIRALQRKDSSRKESRKGKEAVGTKKGKGAAKDGNPASKRQCLEAGPSSSAKGGSAARSTGAVAPPSQQTFSAKELQLKALKDLTIILRQHGVEAKAKKGDVIKQILECQEKKKHSK